MKVKGMKMKKRKHRLRRKVNIGLLFTLEFVLSALLTFFTIKLLVPVVNKVRPQYPILKERR